MDDNKKIYEITKKVYKAAEQRLGNKLDKVILYGSYARGNYEQDSDIDILALADIRTEEAWKARMDISRIIDGLDMEYDMLVSLHVIDSATFYKYSDCLPFYMDVLNHGVIING